MSAQVIEFAEAAARRARSKSKNQSFERQVGRLLTHDFMFWTGASGRRYVHTIYSLIGCPEVPNANFLLVRRENGEVRSVLHVGHLEYDAPSLNLATIRHQGALLGANEVHVHLLGESRAQRGFIEIDLAAAADAASESRSAG